MPRCAEGHDVQPGMHFCPTCGAPVPAPEPATTEPSFAPRIPAPTSASAPKSRDRLYIGLGLGALFVISALGGGLVASVTKSSSASVVVSAPATTPTGSGTPGGGSGTNVSTTTSTSADAVGYPDFLRQVAVIIDSSAPARDQLQQTLTAAQNCTLSAASGAIQLAPIIQNRQSALQEIDQLHQPTSGGVAADLVSQLRRAIQESLTDDNAYARWIDSAGASGCPTGGAPDTSATAALKQQVLDTYNTAAAAYGVVPETRTGF